ncbi:MAG: hypothetical protein A2218_04995 [Elusimicrobia bacterium RIFOXYA2_FULL_53_38]|nr:MAG: hypothetical protein A2218_04995 [Elusimicrobia bacterium RIFOXYA2_FULL_53_38]
MTRCPLCGGDVSALKTEPLECGACGLAFNVKRCFCAPVYEPGLETGIYRIAKERLFSLALDFLERVLPGKGHLLDIGCAVGEFLKAAAARGWKAEGVEIDPVLAIKSSELGFEVSTRSVEEAGLKGDCYSAVTVFETFSQMNDPAAAAAEIYRLLAPGGIIYLREFNAAFHLPLYRLECRGLFKVLGASPSVLHDLNFRPKTLRFMLERAGFRDINLRNSPPTSGDPYRTGGRLGGIFTRSFKILYYMLAQALWVITFGRGYAGSTLIGTARK